MSLHAYMTAHAKGFDENMYLDPATRTYVEETGGAIFLFVTKTVPLSHLNLTPSAVHHAPQPDVHCGRYAWHEGGTSAGLVFLNSTLSNFGED